MSEHIKLSSIKGLLFIGGQITSRIEATENSLAKGKIQVIPPKAIKNGEINLEELYEVEYKTEFDEKKLTRAGDIVVKLSSPYDAALITEKDEGLLITSFCIIIRNTGKNVLSGYLSAFFNSNVYLTQAMSMVSGATVPMLTIGKVKEVVINMMALEEQEQVSSYYKNICKKEIVMNHIIGLEKEKLNSVLGGSHYEN